MSQIVIAKRYAKALINLAIQQKKLEETGEQLQVFSDAFEVAPDFQRVMTDTKLTIKQKEAVLLKVSEKLEASTLVETFIKYLLSKRRILLLPDINAIFQQLLDQQLGRVEAKVTLAVEPDEKLVKEIQTQLAKHTGRKVSVNIEVQPEIMGGMVTRIGSVIIDGSLRNQLDRVYQTITRG